MKKQSVDILDCTLRDGSYLIDYQFTAEDTYIICLGLRRAGFKLIEIGHGTGMGSSSAGKGMANATDEDYIKAARSALEESKVEFGMFFIPGIGKIHDLEMAAGYGMGFVRIGTNITEVDEAKPYIERAKELGMKVSSNLMKSYAVSIDEFIRQAMKAVQFGADTICVVDSAGGMFPDEVREYVRRLKDVTDKTIGFHGHNNLQMAVANTLEAIKAGAGVVDSSLQGMGRSAGNAQTEILVAVLEKLGYDTGADPYKTMDLGERIIRPMMSRQQGVDDISLVSGIAQFHSSFYRTVYEAAQKYQIDPRKLIMEVSGIDRVNVSKELAEATALKIKNDSDNTKYYESDIAVNAGAVMGKEPDSPMEQAQMIAHNILSQSRKSGKESVFSITVSKTGKTSFPFIRQSPSFVIGNVEASDLQEAARLIETLDGKTDWIPLDESCLKLRESALEKNIKKSMFTWYSEERILRSSVYALLSQQRPGGKVLILSDDESVELMKLSLKQQGISVITTKDIDGTGNLRKIPGQISAIVSFGVEHSKDLTESSVPFLLSDTYIYSVRPNAFEKSFWQAVLLKGMPVYRVDSRFAFAAELDLVIGAKKMANLTGAKVLSGVPLVAGGFIGPRGSVVVDSVLKPSRVIGIADGLGGLLPPEEEVHYREAKEKVMKHLIENLYQGDF